MTTRTPIEFTRELDNGRYQRVGNLIGLDDGVADAIGTAVSNAISGIVISANSEFTPIGPHGSITPLVATALTPPIGANTVMLVVESQDVRLRMDGIDPTADSGLLILMGELVSIQFGSGITLAFIETTPSAKVQYQFGFTG